MQMKEITNRWLTRSAKGKGVLACGIRYPDQTTSNHTFSSDFNPAVLDNSWECVSTTFQFLKQHQNDVDQMCWVFDNFRLHCAIRADNTCLGIFTSKNEKDYEASVVNRMISEFQGLKTSEKVAR